MHYINGLSCATTLPDNIPGHIDFIPQSKINNLTSGDLSKFSQWLEANPEFKNYGKQAFDFFLNWFGSKSDAGGYASPTVSTSNTPSTSYDPPGSKEPQSNTTRNVLIGVGVLATVIGGIALSEKNKTSRK